MTVQLLWCFRIICLAPLLAIPLAQRGQLFGTGSLVLRVLAHAITLHQRALEAVSLENGCFAVVFGNVVFVALHGDRVEANGVEIGAFQHRLLRAFSVQNPQIHMLDVELLEQHAHWETLHCGQVFNARLVVVDLAVPLLDERFGHEFHEPSHRNNSLAGVVQQFGFAAESAVDVDRRWSVALQVRVILGIRLCDDR